MVRRDVDAAQRELGLRVREARLARGMSLEEAASAAGLSWGFLADLERGRRAASLAALARVAAALDVTVVQLLASVDAYARR